ncbi:Hypothetical predicted protein [Marmota monax]|uniref:G-protein coupled receptors family 1 profile domain-containing protein n=2 Tax=Marmota TaxID=9992 RepID=A0A5E4BY19_MARMO|nr:Hypothetical predicted protein [Marmota monax]
MWWPVGPHSIIQPMEDPAETPRLAPHEALCLPWASLILLYSLVALTSYLLEVTSHGLLIKAAGPLLPSPLSAAWFGHQATTDAIFTVLLPLTLTWTRSCWPLGAAFCRLDPSLAFLTFYASGRLLTRAAADCQAVLLQPAWALAHHTARQVVFWAAGFWLLLLGLGGSALRALRDQASPADPYNRTPAGQLPSQGQGSRSWGHVLDQLVFGLGVPLGVLSTFHSLLRARLWLARLTGRPPLLGMPWATRAMLFLCWFPFHLLLLLRLLGMQEAGLDLGDVWVLLRPLGFTLVVASGCLNPLLYVCVAQALGRQLCQSLWSCPRGASGEETGGLSPPAAT